MQLTTLRLSNFRSFERTGDIDFGPITLLVGRNNAGKSNILRAIYAMQERGGLDKSDIRWGSPSAVIEFVFADVDAYRHWGIESGASAPSHGVGTQKIILSHSGEEVTQEYQTSIHGAAHHGIAPIRSTSRSAFVQPFLSKRTVVTMGEDVRLSQGQSVLPNFSNLAARIDPLFSEHHPHHKEFLSLIKDVIGLPLSSLPSLNGKKPGMWVRDNEPIYVESMGEGVLQMLGFLASLCSAQKNLFLIEEIENDMHPEALKSLLAVIERKASANQFILSTHNNIVLRQLGSTAGARVYEITSHIDDSNGARLPTSQIHAVEASVKARADLLRRLGYDLSDQDLWNGWLILEEASAERLIGRYLVPWFTPRLSTVRTVAANGAGDVPRTYLNLHKLMLFTHLEPRYRGRVAVLVDGDEAGLNAVAKLRESYKDVPATTFDAFSARNFELYYPARFALQVDSALNKVGQAQRDAKHALFDEVIDWIAANEDEARSEFATSAAEVIEKLRRFEQAFV